MVRLGSPLTATCVISEHCPLLIGQAVQIEWRLGSELILSSPAVNVSNEVSRIVIPSFNRTQTALICCIQDNSIILAGVEIRAGSEKNFIYFYNFKLNQIGPIINTSCLKFLQGNHTDSCIAETSPQFPRLRLVGLQRKIIDKREIKKYPSLLSA